RGRARLPARRPSRPDLCWPQAGRCQIADDAGVVAGAAAVRPRPAMAVGRALSARLGLRPPLLLATVERIRLARWARSRPPSCRSPLPHRRELAGAAGDGAAAV